MRKLKKLRGYTLVEILVITGFIGAASMGVYAIGGIAYEWAKVNKEVQLLNNLRVEIENSRNTKGVYTGIGMDTLLEKNFISSFELLSVESPLPTQLNFTYKDMSARVCSNFSSKMLSSANSMSVIINGHSISKSNDIKDVALSCNLGENLNDVTIVLNKYQDDYSINSVVASVNPPEPPHSDVEIPTFGPPKVPPVIPGFVPSTANPIIYPITTDNPPSFGPIVGGGGPIIVTPGNGVGGVTPPEWNPPVVVKPPATPGGVDEIDTDPNPPPPKPKELEWLGNYNLHGRVFSYLCRVSCWALPMDVSTFGGVSRFLNNFELRVGGTNTAPKMETITSDKYEELSRNGYIFYYAGTEQVGPSNWGQYRHSYIICKAPSRAKNVEYGGVIISCT